MKLTVKQAEMAQPHDRDYKLPDSNGLFLLVKATGAGSSHLPERRNCWRLVYTDRPLSVVCTPSGSMTLRTPVNG